MSKSIRTKVLAVLLTVLLAFGLSAFAGLRVGAQDEQPVDTETKVNGFVNYRSQDSPLPAW